ncbi:hypothetical protein [Pseudomonas sp. CFBP 13719]|uniref:hypothetical protein n=1 Tax=Pseudomonas sp. CFBP 13719 TaxID=2775303 RepID=UPI00177E6FA2|nr:hypothetical protein [Pseudomonas sp. CFBP 13719]MBD8681913.1 hypothetical protein [Pseudomonas sp. CFBP 13719]
MYKVAVLDAFHDDLENEIWDEDAFPMAAEAAERWLLGFSDSTNPEKSALAKLRKGESSRQDSRLIFALAMALCAPSPNTGAIIWAYYGYINKNDTDLITKVSFVAHNAQPEHEVDVFTAFRSLPEGNLHELTARLYSVTLQNVMDYAILWDDPEVFRKCLHSESGLQTWPICSALARFPENTTSRIFQEFASTEQGTKDLFFHRLFALRRQLERVYTHGIERLWLDDHQLGVLMPSHRSAADNLPLSELLAVAPPHKTPGFAQALQKDALRIIRETFAYKQDALKIDPSYWHHVDDLTQTFLDAGITAEQLVSQGACGQPTETVSLRRALSTLGGMDTMNLRFYQVMFRAYLANHEPEHIMANAKTSKCLLAVYHITGDKAYLQAGNHNVREAALGSDLGL